MLARQEPTTDNLCMVCSGQLLCDPDSGEEVCGSCGVVARDNLELAAERRAFTLEEMDKHVEKHIAKLDGLLKDKEKEILDF